MGQLLRSEEMSLLRMYIKVEVAHETLNELGELGVLEFKDLNSGVGGFQRTFANDIKRCDEMERRVHLMSALCAAHVDQLRFLQLMITNESIDEVRGRGYYDVADPATVSFQVLDHQLEKLETEQIQMRNTLEALERNLNESSELRLVLQTLDLYFRAPRRAGPQPIIPEADIEAVMGGGAVGFVSSFTVVLISVSFGMVAGLVNRTKVFGMEKILWRATRGNMLFQTAPSREQFREVGSSEMVEKDPFAVFFQGERTKQKIQKICESFGATLYPVPDSPQQRLQLLEQVKNRVDDLQLVIKRSKDLRHNSLSNIVEHMEDWRIRITKEKAIYHHLNMFNYDLGRQCLIADAWCPSKKIELVHSALRIATKKSKSDVPTVAHVVQTNEQPPTHFELNKYTEIFQGIVSSYGIPRYREINPNILPKNAGAKVSVLAVFTIITFPFLFAVMFGDVGHGIILLLVALYYIRNEASYESKKIGEMESNLYYGRYIMVLMALFSIYTGLLYNECFSVPLNLFGTNWKWAEGATEATQISPGFPYVFGADPAWRGTRNELSYFNSLKMKSSVVIGVTQMMLGLVLSAYNAKHLKQPYDFYYEFIPRVAFLGGLFGYLVFMIFLKWLTFFPNTSTAPNLLLLFISMFLHPGYLNSPDDALFPGQLYIQWLLLLVAMISVPVMLIAKPYLLRRDHLARQVRRGQQPGEMNSLVRAGDGDGYLLVENAEDSDEEAAGHGGHGGEHGEFDFSEVLVHQIIHTIEFVLGSVSNTASYLRLWALSLAHAKLSSVFWELILVQAMATGSVVAIFIGFAVWAGLTLGVLMGMESLSAFLHALRLHWVEFQNKFFFGDGRKFLPFSFAVLVKAEETN